MLKPSERAQTIPFWTLAIIGMLALTLFVNNYATTVTWQVRAQNAADSAAAGGVAVQANVLNEETTLLYAAAVQEFRLRTLNQALLNTINHNGGCTTSVTSSHSNYTISGSCVDNYNALLPAFNAALTAYKNDIQLLENSQLFSSGTTLASEVSAMATSLNVVDSAFSYTSTVSQGQSGGGGSCGGNTGGWGWGWGWGGGNGNGNGWGNQCGWEHGGWGFGNWWEGRWWDQGDGYGNGNCYSQNGDTFCGTPVVEVMACKNVPYLASGVLGGASTFKAVAHGAMALGLANAEVFTPGATTNPATGQAYQPVESSWYGNTLATKTAPYEVDFSGLTTDLYWYGAVPASVSGTNGVGSYTCS